MIGNKKANQEQAGTVKIARGRGRQAVKIAKRRTERLRVERRRSKITTRVGDLVCLGF